MLIFLSYVFTGDKEVDDDTENGLTTSKDSVQVLRLAANLHILTTVMVEMLDNGSEPKDIPTAIPLTAIHSAMTLYCALQQQKSIFLQVRTIKSRYLVSAIVKWYNYFTRALSVNFSKQLHRRCNPFAREIVLHLYQLFMLHVSINYFVLWPSTINIQCLYASSSTAAV